MVIGNGLVARNLSRYRDDKDVLIFASGVSNSGENDQKAFDRETDTLMVHQGTASKFVYFSTCSIFDPSAGQSNYVLHKLRMEALIASHFKDYLIIRLPLLISNAPNPFTFFNFIRNSILNQEPISVYANAWRYIFDAADVGEYVPKLIEEKSLTRHAVNMAYDNAALVPDLIVMFEDILQQKAQKIMKEAGSFYDFDRSLFRSVLPPGPPEFDKDIYNYKTLKKYLESKCG